MGHNSHETPPQNGVQLCTDHPWIDERVILRWMGNPCHCF